MQGVKLTYAKETCSKGRPGACSYTVVQTVKDSATWKVRALPLLAWQICIV